MFCEQCGAKNKQGAQFCEQCGHKLPVSEQTAKKTTTSASKMPSVKMPKVDMSKLALGDGVRNFWEKLKNGTKKLAKGVFNKKALIILCGILVVAAVIGVTVTFWPAPNKGVVQEEVHFFAVSYENDEATVFLTDSGKTLQIEERVSYVSVASDGKSGVFTDDADNLYYYNDEGDGEVYLIAEDCAYGYYYMARDGSAVLYEDSVLEGLYLYQIADGKRSLIIETGSLGYFVCSSDGELVVYSLFDDDQETIYIWRDGQSQEIDRMESCVLAAVSSDGEYVIYADYYKNTVYVYNTKKEEREKIASNVLLDEGGLFFNEDADEMLFVTCDMDVYFDEDELEDANVCIWSDKKGTDVIMEDIRFCLHGIVGQTRDWDSLLDCSIWCDVPSFYGQMLQGVTPYGESYVAFFVGEDGNGVLLTDDADTAPNCWDGETLYYLKEDDLYSASMADDDDRSIQKLAQDVISYTLSGDGECLYYVEDDGTLCRAELNGEYSVELADEVTDVSCGNGGQIYYAQEDRSDSYSLYTLDTKGRSTLLVDEIFGWSVWENCMAYISWVNEDEGTLNMYMQQKDSEFERIFSGYNYLTDVQ